MKRVPELVSSVASWKQQKGKIMEALKTVQPHDRPVDAAGLSEELAGLRAGERLELLYERLGSRLVASTSFGLQAAVMLKLLHDHAPKVPVISIDTGFLFPETYRYAEKLMEMFPLDYRIYHPKISAARMQALWGNLWEEGPEGAEKYGIITKVEPMNRAISEIGGDVWISGLRRAQSETRQDRPFAEQQKKTLKVYPILDWADAQVDIFYHQGEIPHHPLAAQGYVTMGDWHSTRPSLDGTGNGTRFDGQKYECGLHEASGTSDFQI
ncbi:phosphoadenylyl-sulfate reductase [Luteolibacter algae]|uniref:Phosphoadenosine 5'-phosphosulfate reductase n=1 Tax=Luteolibacter algae TaxID=454151 RepID=A0ABW5DBP8_9BACT